MLGLGLGLTDVAVLRGSRAPTIMLSANSLAENSAQNTAIGTLSVVNGTGTYTFTLTDTASNKAKVAGTNGVNLQAGSSAVDYESITSFSITVHADNGVGGTLDRTFNIAVTNVLEVTLSALTLDNSDIVTGSAEDTVVGAIVGKSSGSTLSLTDTASGRFKLSGTNIVAGATATDLGTASSHNITLRETHADGSNSPRDSVIAITVLTDAVPVLTLIDDGNVNPAQFGFTFPFVAGDALVFETQAALGDWSSKTTTSHTVTQPEIDAFDIALGLSAFATGSFEARYKVNGGTYSNVVSFTAIADSAEALAFIARTSGLDATHTTAYKNLINGLVTDGIFAKLDVLYITATQDMATARLNLVSSSFPLVDRASSPTFVADRGFKTASYNEVQKTGYIPSINGVNYTLNAAHAMVWPNETIDSSTGDLGSFGGGDYVYFWTGTASTSLVVNGTNTAAITAASGKGMYLGVRTTSTTRVAYFNGSSLDTANPGTTSTLPSAEMYVGGVNNNGSGNKQISAASFGGSLTGTEVANFYTRLQTYMTAVGN